MLSVIVAVVALAAATLAVSWALTRIIEARNPPRGRFVDVDGVRLHVVELPSRDGDPDAPTALLLHGANLCLDDMQMALAGVLSKRMRVIIPDRPGQGFSEPGPGPVAAAEYQVQLLRGLVQQLGAGPLVVVGHSFGGLIALRYALDDPDGVAGLVLINPTTHPRPEGLPWFQRLAGVLIGPLATYTLLLPLSLAMLPRLTQRMFRPEPAPADYAARSRLTLGLTPRRFSSSLREYSELRDQLIALVPRYRAIATPTVIVAGFADPVVPPNIHAEALAAQMPQAQLVHLAGAGHMAHHAHATAIGYEVLRLGLARSEPVDSEKECPDQ
ncbi:pimeloyl-ACP methyl ester carboxylesterase [Rhodopseudomonas rhenobacensis]|uniref:Pimeloyl-ACP methyl ester carboxylesterase n=1 Tax=Rhodopseudomonas rhenobacensis TaxID=87461 RepID=A0A7W7Z3S0_9BRAD|nr:alpha/beta hydrolase [Rhodopseudomonas rhenobacensis]MBB5047399.1 pimeloyl-ACP methyl ester carboxylesterase [Rhodopseudomonas rhenobacensis]